LGHITKHALTESTDPLFTEIIASFLPDFIPLSPVFEAPITPIPSRIAFSISFTLPQQEDISSFPACLALEIS